MLLAATMISIQINVIVVKCLDSLSCVCVCHPYHFMEYLVETDESLIAESQWNKFMSFLEEGGTQSVHEPRLPTSQCKLIPCWTDLKGILSITMGSGTNVLNI